MREREREKEREAVTGISMFLTFAVSWEMDEPQTKQRETDG